MYRYDGYDDNVDSQDVYKIKEEPYVIDMMIGQKNTKMELDTGASRIIVSECMYHSYLSQSREGGRVLFNDTKVSITDIRCHERHHLSDHLVITR